MTNNKEIERVMDKCHMLHDELIAITSKYIALLRADDDMRRYSNDLAMLLKMTQNERDTAVLKLEELESILPCGDCGNSECNWRGPLVLCSKLGAIGPLCPKCREVVEPDNIVDKSDIRSYG